MTSSVHIFCIIFTLSVLVKDSYYSPILEKFTKKYRFDKRDLQKLGENMKGMKLVQDEFQIGIISHLPEVKRYLQREVMENVVRRRKSIEDDEYDVGQTPWSPAPPLSAGQSPWETPTIGTLEAEMQATRAWTEAAGMVTAQAGAGAAAVPGKATAAAAVAGVEEEKGQRASKGEAKPKEAAAHRGGKENDEDDFYDEDDDDGGGGGDDAEDDDAGEDVTEVNEVKTITRVSILYPSAKDHPSFSNCQSHDALDGDNDGDSEEDEDNGHDEKTDSNEECRMSPKTASIRKQMKIKIKGIFRTNISILAIWIVGICVSVCLLTCGCFYIYIVCFDENSDTGAPSSMPLRSLPQRTCCSETSYVK